MSFMLILVFTVENKEKKVCFFTAQWEGWSVAYILTGVKKNTTDIVSLVVDGLICFCHRKGLLLIFSLHHIIFYNIYTTMQDKIIIYKEKQM